MNEMCFGDECPSFGPFMDVKKRFLFLLGFKANIVGFFFFGLAAQIEPTYANGNNRLTAWTTHERRGHMDYACRHKRTLFSLCFSFHCAQPSHSSCADEPNTFCTVAVHVCVDRGICLSECKSLWAGEEGQECGGCQDGLLVKAMSAERHSNNPACFVIVLPGRVVQSPHRLPSVRTKYILGRMTACRTRMRQPFPSIA